jgi:hypothetical protein
MSKISYEKVCSGCYQVYVNGVHYLFINKSAGKWVTENDTYDTLKEAKKAIEENN